MKHQELAFIIIGTLLTLITINVHLSIKHMTEIDERTKFLCRQYAAGKELADNDKWYTSCINHTEGVIR